MANQNGPPRGASSPAPQGISTPPQRVVSMAIHTTDGTVKLDRGTFQMQILPSGMHLLRWQGADSEEATFVLGGNAYGFTLDLAKVEQLEVVS